MRICDLVMNGAAQMTPSSSYSVNLKIRSILMGNYENAIDNQPNLMISNFWFCLTTDLTRSVVLKHCVVYIGDSVHLRLDKSLYRQIFAILKILYHCDRLLIRKSSSAVPVEPSPDSDSPISDLPIEKIQSRLLDKVAQLLLMIPHSIEITLPHVEIDLMNAEKSENLIHNSIHIVFGVSVKSEVSQDCLVYL